MQRLGEECENAMKVLAERKEKEVAQATPARFEFTALPHSTYIYLTVFTGGGVLSVDYGAGPHRREHPHGARPGA